MYDPISDRYARLLGARVTVIGLDGTVLGESHRSRGGLDNITVIVVRIDGIDHSDNGAAANPE